MYSTVVFQVLASENISCEITIKQIIAHILDRCADGFIALYIDYDLNIA